LTRSTPWPSGSTGSSSAITTSWPHAAYKLPEKDGIAKLKLKTEYADAAASLLEGLEDTFTVNRLKLTPSVMRYLSSTNVENP
jgi:putative transposase